MYDKNILFNLNFFSLFWNSKYDLFSSKYHLFVSEQDGIPLANPLRYPLLHLGNTM